MASVIYNSALLEAITGQIDFEQHDFAVMLCTDSYTPDKDSHTRRSDVTNEVTGDGYSQGGAFVSVTTNADNDNDRVDVSLGEAEWPNSTITARYAIYYRVSEIDPSADNLIAAIDFGSDITSTNGTFALGESTLRIQN